MISPNRLPTPRLGTLRRRILGKPTQPGVNVLRAVDLAGALYVGIGVPIPVLHAGIARQAAVRDRDIETDVIDYAVASNRRPVLGRFNYEELKSGSVPLNGRRVPASPLASFRMAGRIAAALKDWIERGEFLLSAPAAALPARGSSAPLAMKPPPQRRERFYQRRGEVLPRPAGSRISWDARACFSCGQCLGICPAGIFRRDAGWRVEATVAACTGCGRCQGVCPVGAIRGGRNEH